jgi:hypothetical protein
LALRAGNSYIHCRFGNGGSAMRVLLFVLLVILIAQIGFWHALGAILGALAMLFLLVVLAIAVVVVGGMLVVGASFR